MRAHLAQVQPGRRLLQQHAHRVAHQHICPRDHHQRDHTAGHRVEAIPPGGHHHHGRDDHRHRTERVVDHLKERGAHVHVVTRLRAQHHNRPDVGGKSQNAEEQQQTHVLDAVGFLPGEAHDRLHKRIEPHEQQQQAAGRGGDHLKPRPSPRARLRGFAPHHERGDGGRREHRDVGEHVPCVHEQRE